MANQYYTYALLDPRKPGIYHRGKIGCVCRGHRKSAGGFKWKFKEK